MGTSGDDAPPWPELVRGIVDGKQLFSASLIAEMAHGSFASSAVRPG
jgi:hypothetical protein